MTHLTKIGLSKEETGAAEAPVKEALDRVLAHESFSRSPRLSALLEYVVSEKLAGRGRGIKATTIAIEVFDQDSDFDQQKNPLVRVHVGRLRNRLEEYYQGPGAGEPIRFELPKGTYEPTIHSPTPIPAPAPAPAQTTTRTTTTGKPVPPEIHQPASAVNATEKRTDWYRQAINVGAVLVVIVMVSFSYYLRSGTAGGQSKQVAPGDRDPVLLVSRILAIDQTADSEILAEQLTQIMTSHLSRVNGLSVIVKSPTSLMKETDFSKAFDEVKQQSGISHTLLCSLDRDGDRVKLSFQLLDANSYRVLLAHSLSAEVDLVGRQKEELISKLIDYVSLHLGLGDILGSVTKHTNNPKAWLLYRRGLLALAPPVEVKHIQQAINLFERVIIEDPSFAGGYAGSSMAHSLRVFWYNSADPQEDLSRAMELAEKATALDPGFSDGYSALAFAQLQKQEPVAAIDSAEKAITTQPDNAFSRFIAGMVFLSTGQPDKALLHFQEALHLDPVEVQTPYLNALGIAYFYVKDYQSAIAALEKNKNRGGPLGPQSYLFLAASKARLGDESAARKIIAKLKQEFPTFPVHDWLASRTPDKALLQDIKNLMEQ